VHCNNRIKIIKSSWVIYLEQSFSVWAIAVVTIAPTPVGVDSLRGTVTKRNVGNLQENFQISFKLIYV